MRLTVGSSPHVRQDDNITIMMGDVLVALLPVVFIAVYYYGTRVLLLTLLSVISCIAFEYLYRRILHRNNTLGDLSAAVTGVLLACNLPATAPWWFPVLGAFFAIVVVKQLFGGIGRNVFNPAVAAVAFLTVTWPGIMSVYSVPFSNFSWLMTPQNFRIGTTVQSQLKENLMPGQSYMEMLLGNRAGSLGTCAILVIVIAALYLLYRRIIHWQIPLAFVGTVALLAWIFPRSPSGRLDSVFYEITSGSLIFIAVFMATEPATSPVTSGGRLLYGALCGLITVFLRYYGNYPEGAIFAVLLMNPFTVTLDHFIWKQKQSWRREGVSANEKG